MTHVLIDERHRIGHLARWSGKGGATEKMFSTARAHEISRCTKAPELRKIGGLLYVDLGIFAEWSRMISTGELVITTDDLARVRSGGKPSPHLSRGKILKRIGRRMAEIIAAEEAGAIVPAADRLAVMKEAVEAIAA